MNKISIKIENFIQTNVMRFYLQYQNVCQWCNH